MNSRDPYSEDELDHLVRGALKARVAGQAAPDRVWERIKSELEAGQPAARRSFRLAWPPLVVQAGLTLTLVVVGGVGLRTFLNLDDVRNPSYASSPSTTTAYAGEHLAPVPVGMSPLEKRDLYLLKTQYRLVTGSDTEPGDDLSETSPFDTHSLEAESSPPLRLIEERKLMR